MTEKGCHMSVSPLFFAIDSNDNETYKITLCTKLIYGQFEFLFSFNILAGSENTFTFCWFLVNNHLLNLYGYEMPFHMFRNSSS